jgi:hypothetical protein
MEMIKSVYFRHARNLILARKNGKPFLVCSIQEQEQLLLYMDSTYMYLVAILLNIKESE